MAKGKRADWGAVNLAGIGLPGDWVTVTEVVGGAYHWAEFRAYWSTSERLYYWHGESGDSYELWADLIRGTESFENGDRAELFAGIQRWEADHWSYRPGPLIDAAADIRLFRERKDYSAA